MLIDEAKPAGSTLLQLDESAGLEVETSAQLGIATQNLDHSIALLGWGKDEKSGANVWIARNSFGSNWGERGDFYIRRGQNDFGIESEVSAYTVTALQS